MQFWRDQIRPVRYPRDLGRVAQEFRRQLDEVSCGAAAVHHGLLLGGLTVPKGVLQAMFRIYPNKIKKESINARLHGPPARRKRRPPRDKIPGPDLHARLQDLGFEPEYLEMVSGESRRQFLERLGQEMDRGAFVLA